jgi:hypothetical protein
VFLILVITCSETTILLCYFHLCAEVTNLTDFSGWNKKKLQGLILADFFYQINSPSANNKKGFYTSRLPKNEEI